MYFWKELHSNLKILSSSYVVQRQYVENIRNVGVDELALEFDDVWKPISAQIKKTSEYEKFYQYLISLDSHLDLMSKNKNIWTFESLEQAKEWESLRSLANACLNEFPKNKKGA